MDLVLPLTVEGLWAAVLKGCVEQCLGVLVVGLVVVVVVVITIDFVVFVHVRTLVVVLVLVLNHPVFMSL